MRLTPSPKAEQQLLDLMTQAGVNNPTHLMNLLLNFITINPQEAINYAQHHNSKNQTKA